MDLIDNLINELKITNDVFIPSMIKEINLYVLNRISNIYELYICNSNKYCLLSDIVNFGSELELITNDKNNDILSIQLKFVYTLFSPIIDKIKNICLKLNLELVDDIKKIINDLIKLECANDIEYKKYIKYLQINCLYKNINIVIGKESFLDFGISIKIINQNFKNFFENIILKTELFISNENYKDKRFDLYWKAHKYSNNISYNSNDIDQNNNFTNQNCYDTQNTSVIENFKIIQKQNDTNKLFGERISKPIIIEDESFTMPIDNIDN